MRDVVVGLVAHVDAGKTTLAEALLYESGAIRTSGRVDHGDSFLDFGETERRRGITVFGKQAELTWDDVRVTLLDTPGHVDFIAEAERTLRVLDLAVLVVGANDGIGAQTRTLWRLLQIYEVPTLVFVNKADLAYEDKDELLRHVTAQLSDGCVPYKDLADESTEESLAMTDEAALEELMAEGSLGTNTIRRLVYERKAFPSLCGSALRMDGTRDLLDAIVAFAPRLDPPPEFAARVYRVSIDEHGQRLTWLRVTGGSLRAKTTLRGVSQRGEAWENKVDQLRLYNGERHVVVGEVEAPRICTVTGLAYTLPGDSLGAEPAQRKPRVVPALQYVVQVANANTRTTYDALRALADEDPLLGVTWDEHKQEAAMQIMGEVQLEVLQERLYRERNMVVRFGQGTIRYAETIAEPVTGVGHFEPLRHYAEVHVLLEPLERGAGVQYGTTCSEDDLDRNWQRLILSNAMEREHLGALVGAPITDVRITLTAGRAHPKHTEGGDFRQATWRAIRQALMQAKGILLEPWYDFELMVPAERVGRAIGDVQRMGASFEVVGESRGLTHICGRVPASEVGNYAATVRSYTSGEGSLLLEPAGYDVCHDADDVIARTAYEPQADIAHTPDSVFCSHGAGHVVHWYEAAAHAHVDPAAVRRRPWRAADASFFSA